MSNKVVYKVANIANSKKEKPQALVLQRFAVLKCDPGGIRTHDPQLRRLLLYPAELPDPLFFRCANIGKIE